MTEELKSSNVAALEALQFLLDNDLRGEDVHDDDCPTCNAIRTIKSALGVVPAEGGDDSRENIAKAIAYDLENGPAHGARVATTPHLDNYHVNGHVNLLALADAVRAQLRSPAASASELPAWEDPRVQTVYNMLCDPALDTPPNPEEHWEGWVSRNIVKALCPSQPVIDGAPEHVGAIHDALRKANVEFAAFSTDGKNLFGDRKSIQAAAEAFHSHSIIDDLKTQIQHWREECGKLHSRLSAVSSTEGTADE